MKQYIATDGSKWNIDFDGYLFGWAHEDYDGAPDAYDHRHGHARTLAGAQEDIEEWIFDHETGEFVDSWPSFLD
jgi:hypothetical protein